MSQQGASARDIQHHYDVGDDFYRLWLDPNMVYSSAMYGDGDEDGGEPERLAAAQTRKLDYHIEQAGAAGAGHILDVGCGWGACMRRMIEFHKTQRVTGLTLSEQQAEHIAWRHGGGDQYAVHLQSWREHRARGYDGIICVGALEHFADRHDDRDAKIAIYRRFFEFCRDALKPGAALSLQTIAYGDLPDGGLDPFITEAIFPGSDLPTLDQLAAAARGVLHIERLRNDPDDYERTCRQWAQTLIERRAEATALTSEALVTNYIRYLKMSAAGFRQRALYLLRVTLRTPASAPRERRGPAVVRA